ncbi:MAG: alpha-amylase family protein [Bacteroidales bacterium]|nr:alpha-amylase family protein [Bacteroidales bacterium]
MSVQREKLIIYQALVRLFGNTNLTRKHDGTIEENGCGKMIDFNEKALRSIRQLGCNCVWYTGLLQQASATDYSTIGVPAHSRQVLKGKAGSPYAISDYYSVSCDLAVNPSERMKEFDDLVKRTHKVGLRLIMDFVPNHVARQYHSENRPAGVRDLGEDDDVRHTFDPQNNFYYCSEPLHLEQVGVLPEEQTYVENPARVSGNDVFHAWPTRNDWYETVKLNYGVDYCGGGRSCFDPIPSTWLKMRDILLYWCAKGADGFRCDMVFMVPIDFWHWVIPQVKSQYPNVFFIGEIYDPALYQSFIAYGGFDYLYDKVGLYDTLRAIVECRESASALTRCWQSVEGLQDHMLNFLENHDEQRIASDFFAGDAHKAFPALAVSLLMRTNPFMLYFGQEFGERGMDAEGFSGRDGRTTIFDYWALESMQAWIGKEHDYRLTHVGKANAEVRRYYSTLLNLAHEEVFSAGQFYDLTYCNYNQTRFDIHRQFAFFRHTEREVVLVVVNFDAERKDVTIQVPREAWQAMGIWHEGDTRWTDLLTGEEHHWTLTFGCPMEASIPGYGATLLSMKKE